MHLLKMLFKIFTIFFSRLKIPQELENSRSIRFSHDKLKFANKQIIIIIQKKISR